MEILIDIPRSHTRVVRANKCEEKHRYKQIHRHRLTQTHRDTADTHRNTQPHTIMHRIQAQTHSDTQTHTDTQAQKIHLVTYRRTQINTDKRRHILTHTKAD